MKKNGLQKKHDTIADLSNQESGLDLAEYNYWHIHSGAIPLLDFNSAKSAQVLDPWIRWAEVRPGANPTIHYFGARHPGIINLEIRITDSGEIPISNFGWIGNHYRIIGNGADKTTENFWNKLKRMAKKEATQISRCNGPIGKKKF